MKVSVYAPVGGTMAVLVQATPGSGTPPVVLQGLTLENLKEEVSKVVVGMRGLRNPPSP